MNNDKLNRWQETFDRDKAAQSEERNEFQHREALYRGLRDVTVASESATADEETPHIYNIVSERHKKTVTNVPQSGGAPMSASSSKRSTCVL